MPEVRVIQPVTIQAADKLRVAAYARVSSDSADQRNSFSAQVKYYTQFIQAHEDWQFVDIYADQGTIGTRVDKREEFLRLMRDCRAGKIDRILKLTPTSVSIAANGITSRNNKLFNIELFKNRRRPHKLPLLSSYTSRFTDYLILRMINIPCTVSNSSFPSGGGHLLFDGNPCGGKQKRRSVLPLKPFGGGIPESAPRFLDPCLKLLRPAIRGGAAS